MPYAAARSAFEAMPVDAVRGTEMAQSLSSTTKTTGSFQSAARLSDSWKAPWLAAPSPVTATAIRSVPRRWNANACPSAGGKPSAMMPEQEKCVSGSNRCMCPPRPRPSPVSRPKISAVILCRSTPWAMARWCGRCVAVTASLVVRCAQMPAATGSWPAERCISPGTRPLPMSNPGPLSAWYSRRIASS